MTAPTTRPMFDPHPPPDGGLLRMLVGFGVGAAVAAVALVGVEAATGYGLRGLVQNKAQADAAARDAALADVRRAEDEKAAAVRDKEQAHDNLLQMDKNRVAEAARQQKAIADLEDDNRRLKGEAKRLTDAAKAAEQAALNAEGRAQGLSRQLYELRAQSDRKPTPGTGKGAVAPAPPPDPAEPLATLTVGGKPAAEPLSLVGRGSGFRQLRYVQDFQLQPQVQAVGVADHVTRPEADGSYPVTVAGRLGTRNAVGSLVASGPPWLVELRPLAGQDLPTPVLQAGFVKVKVTGQDARYYLTYRPQRLGPQAFDKAVPGGGLMSTGLDEALFRRIEDYREYEANGGKLGFARGAVVRLGEAAVSLAPPADQPADKPVRVLRGGGVSLEFGDNGTLVLKGAAGKDPRLEAVAVVRPLARTDDIRTDCALVFEVNPKHAAGGPRK